MFALSVVTFMLAHVLTDGVRLRRSAGARCFRLCASSSVHTLGKDPTYKNILVTDVDNVKRSVSYVDVGTDRSLPPLVIIPGTAQTAATFAPQFRHLSKTRRLIIPEIRSQGRTELLSEYCTIDQHVEDFYRIFVDHMEITKVHLAGFSFGGRVSLAIAAHYPQHVERLSVTAVPYERPALGETILQSWREGLVEGHLRTSAWSFVINGYSDAFIERNRDKLESYVDMVVKANDVKKLADLLVNGHVTRKADLYSIPSCAAKISSHKIPTQIVGALQDRIAGVESVRELHRRIDGSTYAELNTGHLAPFEDTTTWRTLLLDFMGHGSSQT